MEKIVDAIQLFDEGKTNEALDLLKQLSEKASDDQKFAIAELYDEYGFMDEGIKLLEELLHKYPKEGQVLIKLAEMYIELEQDDLAIHLLNELSKEDDFYVQSLLHLADLYQSQGLFEVSEQKLLEAKNLKPEEIIIDFALGELLFSIGLYHRAIPFYEKAVKEKEINGVNIIDRLAECNASLGNYEQALHLYNELQSENTDTLFKHGLIAKQLERNDIAIHSWKKLRSIDPHYYTVYYELANVLKEEGLLEEAYETVMDGLSYDEFNKELYLLGAQLSIHLSKKDEGIKYVKQAISLDSDYKQAILFLIQLYKEEHLYSEIINVIQSLKKEGSEDPIYDWELARAYVEEEMYDAALKAYEDVFLYLGHDSVFLKEYGYFLIEEGQIDKASSVLTTYMAKEPLDEETAALLERLNISNDG